MFVINNITDWEYEELFVSGSKEKRWYRSETGRLYLFKLPVSLTDDRWTYTDESTGEMWSEKLASEIGKVLKYEVHDVELAYIEATEEIISYYGLNVEKVNTNIYGSLCVSFLKEKESLIEGADMIMDFDPTYDRKTLKGTKEIYSYDLLKRLFSKYNCLDKLYQMIIFDTLLGNTDRHQDNFGIIRNESTKDIRVAPFYDNASCLARELPSHKIKLMMQDSRMFNSYIHGNKASSPIKWGDINKYERLNHFVLLKKISEDSPEIMEHLKRVEFLTDNKIDSLISFIPEHVMYDEQKKIVTKILKTRRDYIMEEFKI